MEFEQLVFNILVLNANLFFSTKRELKAMLIHTQKKLMQNSFKLRTYVWKMSEEYGVDL